MLTATYTPQKKCVLFLKKYVRQAATEKKITKKKDIKLKKIQKKYKTKK